MRAIQELLNEFGENREDLLLLLNEAMGQIAYYRRLLKRLEVDALTGLPGSNRFHDFTENIESRAASVGVVFFDVNNLKYYNDVKGHKSGDLLLQKAAESISPSSNENISVYRIGGDEFAAVLVNCVENSIDEYLLRCREKLAELNSVDDGIYCSIAAGSAFGSGEYKFNDILKLADERMYADKRRMKEKAKEGGSAGDNQ